MISEEVAWHEAGHAVTADLFGCRVRLVTAEPGDLFAGVCRYAAPLVRDGLPRVEAPLITWGAEWQRRLGGDVVVLMAGDMAAGMFAPRPVAGAVRLPEPVASLAQERLEELAAATPAELAEAVEAVSTPHPSDAEQIAELCTTAHGGDLHRAASWLGWLEAECRALLLSNEGAVRRMAGLLQAHGVLGESAVAACLRPEGALNG